MQRCLGAFAYFYQTFLSFFVIFPPNYKVSYCEFWLLFNQPQKYRHTHHAACHEKMTKSFKMQRKIETPHTKRNGRRRKFFKKCSWSSPINLMVKNITAEINWSRAWRQTAGEQSVYVFQVDELEGGGTLQLTPFPATPSSGIPSD